jgi:hypothetical protein
MEAGSINLKTLFGFERRHVVPLFQRPYVWKQETQWEPLWEDVRAIAERELDGRNPRPHFLGAVVLDQIKTPSRHIEARLVIDGQQRLTTLQVLLAAFRDLCFGLGDAEGARKLLRLTKNDDARGPDDDERFKAWPTNVDQAQFRIVMDASAGVAPAQKVRAARGVASGSPLIPEAYEFFYRAIEEWLQSEETGSVSRRVDALLQTLRECLHLVVIDLGEKDDAQVIFETLNARGTPLLPADLVKNFLFHEAELGGTDLVPLYEKHWKPFDGGADFWRKEVAQGRLLRPQIDVFFQHYLTLMTRDEVSAAHLFAAFKDFAVGRPELAAEDHLRLLAENAVVYRSFSEAPRDSRKAKFFQRLGVMETTTAYPFLLGLYHRFGEHEEEAGLDAILADLESFLVRRTICRLTTKSYGRLFVELLVRLKEGDADPAEAVRSFLLAQDAESMRWPTDEELRVAWLELPAYKALSRARLRMILEAIEEGERSQLSEDVALRGKLTIEHLMPQAWEEHWPLPAGQDAKDAAARRHTTIHQLGNLTLLTGKLNPLVSNGPWSRKREKIVEFSALALNRHFHDQIAWDEDAIRRRGERLFETARLIWPRPGGSARLAGSRTE